MAQDDLTKLPGVGEATADKIDEAGYSSYMELATASVGDLEADAGIGDTTARKIVSAAQTLADVGGFESGTDVLKQRAKIGKLQFYIDPMDELLGGGIETQSITEFYGEFGSGKSQVTHQMSVNVQLCEENDGLNGRAVFIDTEDTFRPERIHEMVNGLSPEIREVEFEHRGLEGDFDSAAGRELLVEDFLEKIDVAKAFNHGHQMLLVETAKEIVEEHFETDRPVRLLSVDSLTQHFRAEFQGRGKLAPRQQKLNAHLHDMVRIAGLFNVSVIVTNQVSANPDQFFGDPTQPIGGNILGHTSNFRIYIRKSKENKRVFRLVDAPNLADGEAVCRITGDGVVPE
jgi:DNA repair protein RadA